MAKVFSAPAAISQKLELRHIALEHVKPARVFEAFSGLGEMWQGAWAKADQYVGCDLLPITLEEPMARMCCDNTIALRHLDLQQFNIFDFDAFGSPWDCALILAERRHWLPEELGALVLTDGSSMKLRYGALPNAMAKLIGCQPKCSAKTSVSSNLQHLALLGFAKRAGVKIIDTWSFEGNGSGKGGQVMNYSTTIFSGLKQAASKPVAPV